MDKKYKNLDPFQRSISAGFSTLELLIAMTILVMVLSAVIFVTFGNQSLQIDIEANGEALIKAEELLEEQQALARKDFKMINPKVGVQDGIYQKTISVSTVDYFTKKITSSLTWSADRFRPGRIDLTSLITNFENAVGGDTCYSVLSGDWQEPKIVNTGTTSLPDILGDPSGTYLITDLDSYIGKTYVTVKETSQIVGPKDPDSANNASDVGTLSWNTPGVIPNILNTSDNLYATSTMNGTAATNYLKATNFSFSIPKGATILGISVGIERSRTSDIGPSIEIRDNEIKIIKSDGTLGSQNKSKTTNWPTADTYTSYGSTTDLWGENWTASDINNANFGVAISAKGMSSSGNNRDAQVDHVRITVNYIKQFYILDTSDPENPTAVSELMTTPLAPSVGAGFNAVAVNDNYAYIATDSSVGQLEIIDINSTPSKVVSTLKIGTTGTSKGNSIFYKSGYVYLGLTNTSGGPKEFNVIDVHNPSNPTIVGNATIGNGVNSIYVLGNLAYVASPNANNVLVFNVAVNKLSTSMTPVGSFSTPLTPPGPSQNHGKSLYVVGDTIYLGRTLGTNELFILDTKNLPIITELGYLNQTGSGTSINSLIVRDYLAFILNTAGQFQILKVDDPDSIVRYDTNSITVPSVSGNNTTMDCEGNYFYIGSTDGSNKGSITIITSS
ncbi:MAG TPA: hypothetical protein VJC14_03170 [Candidatus Paceibacterota bacterium]